jgi:hypothetical protein
MKGLYFFFVAILLCFNSCKSKDAINPKETWTYGCGSFEVYQDGYKLSGLCCSYITIPKLKLYKEKSFSADAEFYAYTGAGYGSQPIEISGYLSKDGKILSLHYTVNGTASSIELISGAARMICDCYCD